MQPSHVQPAHLLVMGAPIACPDGRQTLILFGGGQTAARGKVLA